MAAEKVSRARSFFLLETTSLGGRRSVQRKREPRAKEMVAARKALFGYQIFFL